MMDDWLMKTRVLQRQSYGKDPALLEGQERVEYVRIMLLALVDEAMEALHEISWKPWAKVEYFNRDAFIGELVDAGHFLANCAVAAGCTDEEWAQRYDAKHKKNAQRQVEGYTGVKEKCPGCGRAYDDAAVPCESKVEEDAEGKGRSAWCIEKGILL